MQSLNTAIFIQGKIDPWELFNVVLRQLLFFDGRDAAPADIELLEEPQGSVTLIAPHPGEGLPTHFAIWHRQDGTPVNEDDGQTSSCRNPSCLTHKVIPCHLVLGFATNVFYRDDRAWNAGHLQAAMMWHVADFLDKKKSPWKWQGNDGYELHDGLEGVEDLSVAVRRAQEQIMNPYDPHLGVLRRLGFTIN